MNPLFLFEGFAPAVIPMSDPTKAGLLKKPERDNLFVGDNPFSGLLKNLSLSHQPRFTRRSDIYVRHIMRPCLFAFTMRAA